jgi:hypothetical protein
MMMTIIIIIIIIRGYECIWGTFWGDVSESGAEGKERILRGKEDGNMVPIHI